MTILPAADPFDSEQFDATQFVASAVASSDLATCLSRLQFDTANVKKQIQAHVSDAHPGLLARLEAVTAVDQDLKLLKQDLNQLHSQMTAIYTHTSDDESTMTLRQHYAHIKQETERLATLTEATAILRTIARCASLMVRAERMCQAESPKDSHPACALLIVDAESALGKLQIHSKDIQAVGILNEKTPNVRSQLEQDTTAFLQQALLDKNSNAVQLSLQTLFNLGQFPLRVNSLCKILSQPVLGALSAATQISTSSDPAAAFWSRIVPALDVMSDQAMKASLLERSLVATPVFWDNVEESCWVSFWIQVSAHLDIVIKSGTQSSNTLRQLLHGGGYSRLLKLLHDLFKNLAIQLDSPHLTTDGSDEKQMMIKALSSIETGYLNRSVAKLFEPINSAFLRGQKSYPSRQDLSLIVKTIVAELDVSRFDTMLMAKVLKNVVRAINLFAVKCESIVATDQPAYLFAEKSASQSLNFEVANCVTMVTEALENATKDFPANVIEAIRSANTDTNKLLNLVLEPLFKNIIHTMESVIIKIHRNDFLKQVDPGMNSDSVYMSQLLRLLSSLESTVLRPLGCKKELAVWVKTLVTRILLIFLRNASLITPLSESVKLSLTNDMAQLEFALGPLLQAVKLKTSDLGRSFSSLRSYRSLLFCDLAQLKFAPGLETLDTPTLFHHLFSCGPAHFSAPHIRFAMAPAEYNSWLTSHTPQEWFQMIKECMSMYVQDVDKKGDKEFCESYMIMVDVLAERQSRQE